MQARGSASGFDNTVEQECQNLICTHPGENATCTQEGVRSTPTSTPTTYPTPEPITTTLRVIKKVVCQAKTLIALSQDCTDKFIYCSAIQPTILSHVSCYWKWCPFYTGAKG